jgi:hypothetical protein
MSALCYQGANKGDPDALRTELQQDQETEETSLRTCKSLLMQRKATLQVIVPKHVYPTLATICRRLQYILETLC